MERKILPMTVVGSNPRSPKVLAALHSWEAGSGSKEDYDKVVADATKVCVDNQIAAGIDIIADGEQGREDMSVFFAERLGGMKKGQWVRIWGNNYFNKPIAEDRVEFTAPMTVDDWTFANDYTNGRAIVKQMFTGPYTMASWAFYEKHASRRDLVLDLAQALAKEAKALEDAGCPFIQIDEPALCTHPGKEELELQKEALDIICGKLKSSTYKCIHICYGDFKRLFPYALEFPVDQYDLEFTNNAFRTLEYLADYDIKKDIGLGVLDVHTKRIESKEEIQKPIRRAMEFLTPEQIFPKPDCGLKLLPSEEIAFEKLMALGAAVKELREEL